MEGSMVEVVFSKLNELIKHMLSPAFTDRISALMTKVDFWTPISPLTSKCFRFIPNLVREPLKHYIYKSE